MTIRFAASKASGSSILARALAMPVPLAAANDNGDAICSDRLLKVALRHFAEHGLSAAERARQNAEQAFFADRREDYRWWLAICGVLDRRMAAAVAFRSRRRGS
jgi:hypothetical protein